MNFVDLNLDIQSKIYEGKAKGIAEQRRRREIVRSQDDYIKPFETEEGMVSLGGEFSIIL